MIWINVSKGSQKYSVIVKKVLFKEGKNKYMGKIILYHGSPDKDIVPTFGFGDDKHDYGRGFYLTENFGLAKEWAVCRPNDTNGWVHK